MLRLSYKVQVRVLLDRSPIHCTLKVLLQLGHNKHRRCQREQEYNVHHRKTLSLKDHLQWRKVNDEQLANQRESDGKQKHFVGKDANLFGRSNSVSLLNSEQRFFISPGKRFLFVIDSLMHSTCRIKQNT